MKDWNKRGIKYNAGNVNILRYAFRTLLFWSTIKGQKMSKINKVEIHPKLF
jgi:hypothetical protein